MASHSPGGAPRPAATGGMVDRLRRLLSDPRGEWARIDAAPMSSAAVFRSWAVPLAAIGPVAGLIGAQLLGYGAFGFGFRPSLGASIGGAVLGYVLSLIAVFVLARVVDALAPRFGGTPNPDQAMKVAVFSSTAAWLAGVFQLVPALAILGLAGLYSVYLLWTGLPMLMRAPADRAAGYVGATLALALVVWLVVGAITGAVTARVVTPPALAGGGTVTVPGFGTVDTGKLEAAAARMNEASAKMEADAKSGKPVTVTPPAVLQAMLPATIGGWTRGDVETASAGAGGVGGSRASATYTMGDDSIELAIADIGAMGGLAGMAGAMNIQSTKQTATGYDRTETIDGRIVHAKWDGGSRSGGYDLIVGNRFAVSAEGTAPSDAAFKAAVTAIDLGRLEALAKR